MSKTTNHLGLELQKVDIPYLQVGFKQIIRLLEL